ncbi:MAG: MarR family transcriptional regulator [Flavobacteriaceae bacterium]|jgi:DNA-binding MarR family transcriptional regulator|nr:MarR family transcriptional regulator [Flavobacteriaceae bacterium]MCB0484944.1 MarR family transcriptional regulator [Flavobacteriaceae bacterium]
MQKETTIDHALRATWQAVAKMYNEQAARHNSTMATAFVLLNIDSENGTPSTALGPQMGMEPTSLSRILKNMEDIGLIYRERNPEDGRSVLIKLTDFGKEKRKVSRQSVITFNEKVRENLSKEKINHFFEVIDKINQLINERSIFTDAERKAV